MIMYIPKACSDSKIHDGTPDNSINIQNKRKLLLSVPSKKKIRFDREENNEVLGISINRDGSYEIQKKNLNETDKDLVRKPAGWLTERHMSTVNKILKSKCTLFSRKTSMVGYYKKNEE